jgi:hypothetical protein
MENLKKTGYSGIRFFYATDTAKNYICTLKKSGSTGK